MTYAAMHRDNAPGFAGVSGCACATSALLTDDYENADALSRIDAMGAIEEIASEPSAVVAKATA